MRGGRWTWPAAAAVASLVGGGVSGWTLLQHTGVALLGLLALCLLATTASGLVLTAGGRATSRAATAGERVIVRYTIRNRGIWPVVWTALQPEGLSEWPVEAQIVALGPRGRRQIVVSLPCPRRGRWPAGGWRLHTGDPFGFFGRSRAGSGQDTITVYPRPVPLPDLALPAPRGRGLSTRGRAGADPSAMVREVRPYRAGDPLSRIHWLSTARHDALMVKEPEGEPAAHGWLVLDLDAAVHYGEGEGDSAELVVGAARYLLQRQLQAHIATGLLLVGPDTALPPDGSRGQGERLLAALATAEPAPASVERGMRLLRSRARTYGPARRSTLIVVTPWADVRWSACLPALAQDGYAVQCVLLGTPDSGRDAMLDAQAAVLRASGIHVYRHSAWAP